MNDDSQTNTNWNRPKVFHGISLRAEAESSQLRFFFFRKIENRTQNLCLYKANNIALFVVNENVSLKWFCKNYLKLFIVHAAPCNASSHYW